MFEMKIRMKLKYFFVLLLIIAFGTSCARVVEVFERPMPPDAALFESAERKFDQAEDDPAQYDQALALYEQYLDEYPDADMVPAAMLKIGMIRTETGKYEKARQMHEKVMARFPETPFARWAEVETLYAYFREGHYDVAVDRAEKLDMDRFPPEMRMRINRIAGDAYMALENYDPAFDAFLRSFEHAPEERRLAAGRRLMAAAAHLERVELEGIIAALDGKPPAGYLLYQKGLILADAGRISEAMETLSAFAERFDDHALLGEARKKLEQLEAMAYFEGHRIGVLLPLTGEYGMFGRNALRGIELALAEYAGRFDVDPPPEIVVQDTGTDPEQAVEAVRRLAKERVAAIVGPIVMAAEAAKEAQKLEVPIVTLSQSPDITDIGDYVFRNFLTPKMQVAAIADYAAGSLGLERFAVLYPDEPYGETFLHLFWDALLEKDAVVVGAEAYNPEKTDFSDPIKKIVGLYHDVPDALKPIIPIQGQLFEYDMDQYEDESDVPGLVRVLEEMKEADDDFGEPRAIVDFDAVFIPDSPRVAGLIIPQLRYYDISDVHLLGTHLWHSQRLIDTAGRQLRQVIIPEGFFAQSRNPVVGRFVDRFGDIYADAPGIIEASGYDSAMMVFEVIARPDVGNRVAVKNALLDMPPFDGVTGETVFDDTGDAVKDLYLLEVVRGGFREIR